MNITLTLTVTAGPHAGRVFAFDRHDTFLVGRTRSAHFQLSSDDPYFSRRHFVVEVNPPRVRVYDLNSRNGVTVNGQKVTTADLVDGDELQAGNTVFRLSVPAPADPDDRPTLGLTVKSDATPDTIDHISGPPIPGYALEQELGRGAMGVVYRAIREADGQAVAVKVIAPANGVAHKDAQRFLREAQIMTALSHRYIVRGLDSGEAAGQLYLAMELVSGPDLLGRVKDRGPLDVKKAVRLTMHALDALAHAHRHGYVHRDVKPGNLLIDGPKKSRHAKLADFGLARAYNECNMSGPTMQDEADGTPGFMAPEQVTHYRDARPAADQYAAAATLYFLLTGEYVLDFEPLATAQMIQIATEERVPIRRRRAGVPAGLEAAIQKALALEAKARHANVRALRKAISPFA